MSAANELANFCLSPAVRAELVEIARRHGRTPAELNAAEKRIEIRGSESALRFRVDMVFADGQRLRADLTADGWSIDVNNHSRGGMGFGDRG